MPIDSLLIERTGNICTLVLNRPEKKNSLSPELAQSLLTALEKLSGDDTIRVIVIRGSGDQAFCSGYDIGSLPAKAGDNTDSNLEPINRVESIFKTIIHYPWPVIAMLNGAAYGAGFELAICCDIRIGAEDIRIGMPPAKLGIAYPWNGLKRFIQSIGLQTTREMFFTGQTYEGSNLKQMGLVDHLVPRKKLEAFTYQMTEAIAGNAPLALKGTKKVINLILDDLKLDNKKRMVAEAITQETFLSEDVKEGRLAFLEKRPPQFKGR